MNVLTYVDAFIAAGVALVGLVALLWVGTIRARRHRAGRTGGPSADKPAPGPGEPAVAADVPAPAAVAGAAGDGP
jgi:hypothetical protein